MDRRLRVEPRIDFFQCLVEDVSLLIAKFIDDEGDLVRFTAVSRFWRQYAIANGLAKQASLKAFPQLCNTARVVDTTEGTNVPTEHEILEKDHKVYIALLHAVARSKSLPKNCIVISTLNPRDRLARGDSLSNSYWCTVGHCDPNVQETLTFKIRDGIWSIIEVDIQPLLVYFQAGNPLYAGRAVQFRFGMAKGPKTPNKAGNESSQNDLPEIVWTYSSPEFPVMQANCLPPFTLPKPVLCFGGYFQIQLMDRAYREQVDWLFNLCVHYVRVEGRPLFPAFKMEQHGNRWVLHYEPDKVEGQAIDEDRPLNSNWSRIVVLDILYYLMRRPNNPHASDADANNDAHPINHRPHAA